MPTLNNSVPPAHGSAPPFRTALGIVGPAALTLLLGLWGLTRENSMWRDEAATWAAAHRTLPELAHMLDRIDVVHGVYYLFMHGVFAILGDSLIALRLPSVLAMAGAAAATAATARRLAGPRAGAAAGTAFALVPSTQHYAQEGRSYALVVAAVAVATLLLVTLVDGRGEAGPAGRRWAGYAAAMLAAALLNWFSLLVLPAHAATVCMAHRRGATRRLLTRWPAATAAVAAGALPVILASRSQAQQIAWIRPLTWSTALAPLLLLTLGLLCAALLKRHPNTPPTPRALSAVSLGLPLLAFPLLALMLLSLVKPLYLDRYVLYANVGLALLIGATAGTFIRSWRPLVALALAVFAALLPLQLGLRTPQSRVDDVLAPAETVARASRPGDGVVFIPSLRRDTAEVSPGSFAALDDLALAQSPSASGTLQGKETAPRHIRRAMLGKHRILIVADADGHPGSARDTVKRRVLVEHFTRCTDTEVRGRRVQTYERGTRCTAPPSRS
ncbi:glycosyltransferase family 39 protein [Streptomyces sp. G44]|uniref:glycosyltransferase family 39 protein n=1 Tax=Streptomyces sp. G44 TaxID=2807632 RepID=UPI0019616BA2|nr:glycosyltransferase family 39 protein [Streptomyces sp. G44]MBM7167622.1 glycosyltransferase family 39 protein [Streptomyces sp. G44]